MLTTYCLIVKIETTFISKKIKTYETSILPFEDCCTIFVPKHPVIYPNLNKCIEYETSFEFNQLIEECVDNIEIITDFKNNEFKDLL